MLVFFLPGGFELLLRPVTFFMDLALRFVALF